MGQEKGMVRRMVENQIFHLIFPNYLSEIAMSLEKIRELQEIRLRVGQPILLMADNREWGITKQGEMTMQFEKSYQVLQKDLEDILMHLCHYSLYAYEEEITRGYFTISGGHRIGIAGQVVMEGNKVRTLSPITSMNIRIAHEKKGVANRLIPYLYRNGTFQDCLLISPPGCGKTTMLRDIIRMVSEGNEFSRGKCVGVVDERSELGGSYLGVMQNDLGCRTDLLDSCPKALGMMMLLRSMNPYLIAVDEIGGEEDIVAIRQILKCGCHLVATVHGSNFEEVCKKEGIYPLIKEGCFERYIILGNRKGVGTVEEILDRNGNELIQGGKGK